jgi:hypothetical protein
MAAESDTYQERADRLNAAAMAAPNAAETRFIVPWRMERATDLSLGPIKEKDSGGEGECGCGISSDDNY